MPTKTRIRSLTRLSDWTSYFSVYLPFACLLGYLRACLLLFLFVCALIRSSICVRLRMHIVVETCPRRSMKQHNPATCRCCAHASVCGLCLYASELIGFNMCINAYVRVLLSFFKLSCLHSNRIDLFAETRSCRTCLSVCV